MPERIKNISHLLILCITCIIHAKRQDTTKNKELINFFINMKNAYSQTAALSFSVKYTYSDEQKPSMIIDSLSGNYKISGSNYWCMLDSTETLKADSIVIVLFRRDKMMYVSKIASQAGFNPAEQVKIFLATFKKIQFHIDTTGNNYELSVDFPPGSDYKNIYLQVDRSTGYLVQSVYILRTKMLVDNPGNEINNNGEYSEFARVQADYLYNTKSDAPGFFFNENRYITQVGGKIITTKAFKDYQLFFGNKNH